MPSTESETGGTLKSSGTRGNRKVKGHLMKVRGYSGRNVMLLNITIKMRTTVRKFNMKYQASSQNSDT